MRPLTDPQKALLGLLCEGQGDKEIAAKFGITQAAVSTRVTRLKRRFGAVTRAQLVHRAYDTGMLVPRPVVVVRVPLDPPEVITARRAVLLGKEETC